MRNERKLVPEITNAKTYGQTVGVFKKVFSAEERFIHCKKEDWYLYYETIFGSK